MEKIKSCLKWLNAHTPMWIINAILAGGVLFTLIYGALGHYIGHGLPTPTLVNGVYVMVTPPALLSAYALPLGLFFGILLTVCLIYWEISARKKYGKEE
jgi:hypothetical protein